MSPSAADQVTAIIQAFRAELDDAMKPLSLLVKFTVKEADAEKVEAAFGRAMPLTAKEPGSIVFTLNREPRDPGRFTVFEQWRSLADLEAHLRTDYIARLRGELDQLIVGAPEFRVLVPAA